MTGEKQKFPHLQKTPGGESESHRPVMLTWLLGKSWNKSSWNTLTQEGGAWEQSAWIDQPQIILTNPITFHDKLTRFADEGKGVDGIHPNFSTAFSSLPQSSSILIIMVWAGGQLDG